MCKRDKEKVNEFLGVDLENLKNVDEDRIIDIFKKYPMLIWKTKQSLSDFMVNTKAVSYTHLRAHETYYNLV